MNSVVMLKETVLKVITEHAQIHRALVKLILFVLDVILFLQLFLYFKLQLFDVNLLLQNLFRLRFPNLHEFLVLNFSFFSQIQSFFDLLGVEYCFLQKFKFVLVGFVVQEMIVIFQLVDVHPRHLDLYTTNVSLFDHQLVDRFETAVVE